MRVQWYHSILVMLTIVLVAGSAHAQLYVNEVMSSNTVTIADEDGTYSDWFEIYNSGPDTINLNGYYATDTPANPTQWQFPAKTIAPGTYLFVWASGKNRTSPFLHTNFAIKAGGEPIVITMPDGVTIVDTLPAFALSADQSYGRLPDGSTNLTLLPSPTPGLSNVATVTPPANNITSDLSVNEVMSSNIVTILDEDGTAADWVELYNAGNTPLNLSGYYLTDSPSNLTQWQFPERILGAHNYLLVWASNKNRGNATTPLHTNFAIKAGGEPIILTAPDGITQVSAFPAIALAADQSYGRLPDGSTNLTILPAPSPGTNNGVLAPPSAPLFSKAPGFYNGSFSLTITTAPDTTVYYTLDGSTPTSSSPIYAGPIPITNTTGNCCVAQLLFDYYHIGASS